MLQYTPIVAVTFLAKVSLPPLVPLGLGIDLPLILAASLVGLATGVLEVHRPRLMMYLAVLVWLGGTQVLRGEPFSPNSIALMAVLFLPLTFRLGQGAAAPGTRTVEAPGDTALRVLESLALLFAALGVLQFALQYRVGSALVFPVEQWVPSAYRVPGFNTRISLVDGGAALKSNGVFFLEPSFFSQFMALGLLAELSRRSRPSRVALLAAGLAVSYSGTGLIVAGVGLLVLVIVKGRWDVLLGGLALVLLVVLLDAELPMQSVLRRVDEFQSAHSSGSARFIAWIDMFDRQWWTQPERVLFGAGAGSFVSQAAMARQPTAEMSFSKMLFEYGVSGALMFFGFLVCAINSVRAPLALRLGLCTTLLVNGAFVAFPVGIAASILLWPGRAGTSDARLVTAPT